MYGKLFKNVLYPFYENKIAHRNTPAYINEYQCNLKKTKKELEVIQLKKLKDLLRHAYTHCDYYREEWDSLQFDPESVSNIRDIECLPVIDKETIRKNYSGFVAHGYGSDNISKRTGGSSGVPFKFELDQQSDQRRQAVMWRGYGWLGAGLGEKALYIWGANIEPLGFKHAVKEKLYHAFYNRKMLNSFHLNESNIGNYITEVNSYKPSIIVGYVSPLLILADYVLKNSLSIRSPKAILTGAEPLYEFQREKIEKAFSAPVYNTYGCREFMLMGAECEVKHGFHLNIDHLVVEVLDEDGNNKSLSGDLAITDLHNYGFPLIRYLNGDRGTVSEDELCSCGSPLPLLKSVDGRRLDVIKTPDGKSIVGEFFPHLLKDFDEIKQFQVIQNSIDELKVKLVLYEITPSNKVIEKIKELMRQTLGPSVLISVSITDHIELTESGKLRVVISRV